MDIPLAFIGIIILGGITGIIVFHTVKVLTFSGYQENKDD